MRFNRFRLGVILRILLLVITLFALASLDFTTSYLIFIITLSIIAIYQVYNLIHYTEKTNRELGRFLDSIRFSDFSQSFGDSRLGPSFKVLKESFNRVTQEFQKIRAEKEESLRYFQTVVQHVGIGLISFKSDGSVEFINKAALKLLNLPNLKNIHVFKSANETFFNTITQLKTGEQALAKLPSKSQEITLAVNVARIRMKQELYSVVSLQNIQSELERERMSRELEIAQEVQTSLFPEAEAEIPGFDIAGRCEPASEVGGDYYDIIRFDDSRHALVMGDVSGKGLPAAIYMTLTKGILHALLNTGAELKQIVIKLNELIYRMIGKGCFVSLVFAILDAKNRSIQLIRAGHNPPILFRSSDQSIHLVNPDGLALGLEAGKIFDTRLTDQKVVLDNNDLLILYTDGITEARNEKMEEYGDDRFKNHFQEHHSSSAGSIVDGLFTDLKSFRGKAPVHDDKTIIVLKAL